MASISRGRVLTEVPGSLTGRGPASAQTQAEIGNEIGEWLRLLFPISRSITGEGNRETLRLLNELVPITIHEVSSGTPVYDWFVPNEWNIRDAWIATPDGRRVIDFRRSNLHVVSYSEPVRATMDWRELQPHLHRHPHLPHAIPYRTSYYHKTWGFCLTHEQYLQLEAHGGPFEVVIDSTMAPGSLTYGEVHVPGSSTQEVLVSCYICHPSMANDSLSGVLLAAFLARALSQRQDRHYTYRFVFVPETIGAITYCAMNEAALKRIDVGLVATTVGGPGQFGYKQSFEPGHAINTLIEEVFREAGIDFITYPFDIHGSDERQYSSQGFGINVATICRDRYYEYPQYHSSLDDLSFVTGPQIAETLSLYLRLIDKLEQRHLYRNRVPYCERMLSRHDLYPKMGGAQRHEVARRSELDLILWLLHLCDGRLSLTDIARRLEVEPAELAPIVGRLVDKAVLERV